MQKFHLIFTAIYKYTAEDLYMEIVKLQKDVSEYSLMIVKCNYEEYKSKILLQYDRRWKCYLLPYFNTLTDEGENQKKAIDLIAKQLYVNSSDVSTRLVTENLHTKHSVSNDRTKQYHHKFYEVIISSTNKKIIRRKFTMDDRKYQWFTLDEMLNNNQMMRKNQSVIEDVIKIYK